MKIGILGYYGLDNLGDEAILTSILRGLQGISSTISPVVFSSNPQRTEGLHSVRAIPSLLPESFSKLFIKLLGRNRKQFLHLLSEVRSLDVLIVGGGGLFFDHPNSNRFLLELVFKIKFAYYLGIPIVFFGVSVGPLHFEESRKLLKGLFSLASLVVVRDEGSRNTLCEIGVEPQRIHVTRDLVFALKGDGRKEQVFEKEGILLTKDVLAVVLHGESGILNEAQLELIGRALKKFQTANDCQILFVPMQINEAIDDTAVHEYLLGSGRHIIRKSYPAQTMIDVFSRARLTLAIRLHGTIFSICAGTSVVGISYAKKVTDLFQDLHALDLQIPLSNLSEDTLLALLNAGWNNLSSSVPNHHCMEEAARSFKLLARFLREEKLLG